MLHTGHQLSHRMLDITSRLLWRLNRGHYATMTDLYLPPICVPEINYTPLGSHILTPAGLPPAGETLRQSADIVGDGL